MSTQQIGINLVDSLREKAATDDVDIYELAADAVQAWVDGIRPSEWPAATDEALRPIQSEGTADDVLAWLEKARDAGARKGEGALDSLVFVIDVSNLTGKERDHLIAAVSAQLDDGTEDYIAPASYTSEVFTHSTEEPILSAVAVGLGL